jgi:phytoene synthase
MTIQLHAWENRLLGWAYEALESHQPREHIISDKNGLRAAYAYCENLTRESSRTFYMAARLLPPEKRRATYALYAFCRVTDNIVDQNKDDETARDVLKNWQSLAMMPHPPAYNPVAAAWSDARALYNIPHGYGEQLINGVARDLSQKRYATFADLAEYAYGVASTVGLMAMHIIGFQGQDALAYAVKLGIALQLTNILRDVAEDWRAGRLYLPQDELAAFGLSEEDIAAGVVDDRWRAFMRFQIERSRRLYAESWEGIAMLKPDGRFAIAAAADLYRAILADIEAYDYDVFSRRAHVSTSAKVMRLPHIWSQVLRMNLHAGL